MGDATLSAIGVYPIKSCRRVERTAVTVGPFGLEDDRTWQVVDADGGPLTQREAPMLATVQPTLVDGGLRIERDGSPTLEVARPAVADRTCRSYLDIEVRVGDAGDEAAAWFGDALGRPCRLVAATDGYDRRLPTPIDLIGQGLSLADLAPVLLANEASCRYLTERAVEPFALDRFRPNLSVDGADPWSEDTWRRIQVGTALLDVRLPWPRCAIPQIDQVTAERHREPAVVLKQHRWCADPSELTDVPDVAVPFLVGNALFASGCTIGPVGAVVQVGDRVEVLETGPAMFTPG